MDIFNKRIELDAGIVDEDIFNKVKEAVADAAKYCDEKGKGEGRIVIDGTFNFVNYLMKYYPVISTPRRVFDDRLIIVVNAEIEGTRVDITLHQNPRLPAHYIVPGAIMVTVYEDIQSVKK